MPVTVSPFCQGPFYHVGERQWPVSSMTCKQLCSSACSCRGPSEASAEEDSQQPKSQHSVANTAAYDWLSLLLPGRPTWTEVVSCQPAASPARSCRPCSM